MNPLKQTSFDSEPKLNPQQHLVTTPYFFKHPKHTPPNLQTTNPNLLYKKQSFFSLARANQPQFTDSHNASTAPSNLKQSQPPSHLSHGAG